MNKNEVPYRGIIYPLLFLYIKTKTLNMWFKYIYILKEKKLTNISYFEKYITKYLFFFYYQELASPPCDYFFFSQ